MKISGRSVNLYYQISGSVNLYYQFLPPNRSRANFWVAQGGLRTSWTLMKWANPFGSRQIALDGSEIPLNVGKRDWYPDVWAKDKCCGGGMHHQKKWLPSQLTQLELVSN